MNLETAISLRIASAPTRDLPKHVYPKGRKGMLYFVRGGVCVRIFSEPGTLDFADEYEGLLRKWGPTPRKQPEPKGIPLGALPPAHVLHQALILKPDGSLHWRERTADMFTDSERFDAEARANMWNGRCAGKRADRPRTDGRYRVISFMGRTYLAHRVIWMMVYGSAPDLIDHMNGEGCDNRIENLRSVDGFINQRNRVSRHPNTSGATGVSKHAGKWKVSAGGKFLGVHADFDDAVAARKEGERQLGYTGRTGARES